MFLKTAQIYKEMFESWNAGMLKKDISLHHLTIAASFLKYFIPFLVSMENKFYFCKTINHKSL